jgi:hypothetical protein
MPPSAGCRLQLCFFRQLGPLPARSHKMTSQIPGSKHGVNWRLAFGLHCLMALTAHTYVHGRTTSMYGQTYFFLNRALV